MSDSLSVHPPKLAAVELRGPNNFCASWDVLESEENVIVNNHTWRAGTHHSVLANSPPAYSQLLPETDLEKQRRKWCIAGEPVAA